MLPYPLSGRGRVEFLAWRGTVACYRVTGAFPKIHTTTEIPIHVQTYSLPRELQKHTHLLWDPQLCMLPVGEREILHKPPNCEHTAAAPL